MSIQGNITLSSSISQAAPTTLPGAGGCLSRQGAQFNFTGGTASNQCDRKYLGSLTLAGSPTALNLQSLTDVFGNAVSFARVKSILVINTSQVDGHNVLMGYATTTSNAWTGMLSNPGQVTIGPSTATNTGMVLLLSPNTSGWAVSGSSNLLNFDPGSATVTITVEICGCSV